MQPFRFAARVTGGSMEMAAHEITTFLHAWQAGHTAALEQVMPLVYNDLGQIARRYLRHENTGQTLQTADLINEAFLRLINQQQTAWQNRAHFFRVAARIMRNLLVDRARAKQFAKRGGGARQVDLAALNLAVDAPDDLTLALDDALQRLAEWDERKSRLVELRYFGGLTVAETAEALGVSEITVRREWAKARAWLHCQLTANVEQ